MSVLTAEQLYRKYVIDGVSSSGFNKPNLDDLRDTHGYYFAVINGFTIQFATADQRLDALEAAQTGGLIAYANSTAMNADTTQTTGTVAITGNDGNQYRWSGSAWVPIASFYLDAHDFGFSRNFVSRVEFAAIVPLSVLTEPAVPYTGSFAYSGMGNIYAIPTGGAFNAIRIPAWRNDSGANPAIRPYTIELVVKEDNESGADIVSPVVFNADPSLIYRGDLIIPIGSNYTNSTGSADNIFVGIRGKTKTATWAQMGIASAADVPYRSSSKAANTTDGGWSTFPTVNSQTHAAIELIQIGSIAINKSRYIAGRSIPDGTEDHLLVLPDNIPSVIGTETWVYTNGLFLPPAHAAEFDMTVSPALGKQMEEGLRIRADDATTTGGYTLTVVARDHFSQKEIGTKTSTIKRVAASYKAGVAISTILVGDSLTAASDSTAPLYSYGYVQQLYDLMDNAADPDLTLVGTQGTGNYKHEGRGGWTVQFYYNDPLSPFYNPSTGRFDWEYYCGNNSISAGDIDHVCFLLGHNDARGDGAAPEGAFGIYQGGMAVGMYEWIIKSIHDFDPNTKITIAAPITPAGQDAFGTIYLSGADAARTRRNFIAFSNVLQRAFDGRSDNVYFLQTGLHVDTRNNMFLAPPEPVNAGIEIAGTVASMSALDALAAKDGKIYKVTSVAVESNSTTRSDGNIFGAATSHYFVKMGPSSLVGVQYWREATERDGIVRRQTDALHPPKSGNYQIAQAFRAHLKRITA
jgi:hypothetical protein